MIYQLSIDERSFEEVIAGGITALINLPAEAQGIQTHDQIILRNTSNPFRTAQIDVESVLVAGSMDAMLKVISKYDSGYLALPFKTIDCNSSADYNKYRVVGVRFELDHRRQLNQIPLPFAAVWDRINELCEALANGNQKKYYAAVAKWKTWHLVNFKRQTLPNSLEDNITFFDDSIADYIYSLTVDLAEHMRERGYEDINEYLDRRFRVSDYDIYQWWSTCRIRLIEEFAGGYQYLCSDFVCYTAFDEYDD